MKYAPNPYMKELGFVFKSLRVTIKFGLQNKIIFTAPSFHVRNSRFCLRAPYPGCSDVVVMWQHAATSPRKCTMT